MATETLRPNAAGDETSIESQLPDSTFHWDKVDEASADDNTTFVYNNTTAAYQRDLYNLPASSGSGTINFIKIYFRVLTTGAVAGVKPSLKSNSTVTDGTEIQPPAYVWTTYSQQWNTNPADSQAWEWADIDALQIGVSLKPEVGVYGCSCTQVYVEVDYTPPSAPTVTTQAVTSIGTTTATGNGNITDDGGETPSAWGSCLALTANPDTGDTVDAGSGAGAEGAFTTSISGLATPMKYHVRAYATNTAGTSYGADVTFLTLMTSSVIVGNKVTTSRALAFDRDSSVIVGIVASASRALAIIRASSVISGIVASASRARNRTIASAVYVGIVASASAFKGTVKSATVVVGILAVAKGWPGFIRFTLKPRVFTFALKAREFAYTLKSRVFTFTLKER